MILLQYPWQDYNGASHRRNIDTPPAGGALAASQSGIRKDPWAVADRGNDPTRRRRLLNETDRFGIATQRIGIPGRRPE